MGKEEKSKKYRKLYIINESEGRNVKDIVTKRKKKQKNEML